jgi:hypothetical protein
MYGIGALKFPMLLVSSQQVSRTIVVAGLNSDRVA